MRLVFVLFVVVLILEHWDRWITLPIEISYFSFLNITSGGDFSRNKIGGGTWFKELDKFLLFLKFCGA